MEPLKPIQCSCGDKEACRPSESGTKQMNRGISLLIGLVGLTLWYVIYKQLEPFSYYFAYDLLTVEKGSHLGWSALF